MSIASRSQTVVIMGQGDVLVGSAVHGNGTGSLAFIAAPVTMEPGTPAPELDGKVSLEDCDLSITFTNLAAIDSMVERLTEMRAMMAERGAQ